jgi:hypothetical protein
MPCSAHQSLFESDKRIWGTWNCLNDKTNRSASETDGTDLPGRVGIAATQ